MKSAISAVALCVILGGTTTAMAEGNDSNMGIGVGSTFYVTGLQGRFALNPSIHLEGTFGFTFASVDDGAGGSSSVTALAFGVRGLYNLFDFGAAARVFGFGGLSIATLTDADTLIGLEGGLKIEWFPVPYASLGVGFGLGVGINDAAGVDGMGTPVSGTTFDIGVGDLMGDASWTFWW